MRSPTAASLLLTTLAVGGQILSSSAFANVCQLAKARIEGRAEGVSESLPAHAAPGVRSKAIYDGIAKFQNGHLELPFRDRKKDLWDFKEMQRQESGDGDLTVTFVVSREDALGNKLCKGEFLRHVSAREQGKILELQNGRWEETNNPDRDLHWVNAQGLPALVEGRGIPAQHLATVHIAIQAKVAHGSDVTAHAKDKLIALDFINVVNAEAAFEIAFRMAATGKSAQEIIPDLRALDYGVSAVESLGYLPVRDKAEVYGAGLTHSLGDFFHVNSKRGVDWQQRIREANEKLMAMGRSERLSEKTPVPFSWQLSLPLTPCLACKN